MTVMRRIQGRAAALDDLKRNPRMQVLVIGGGINGAGTFRDLALQGIDCLLVDAGDWGSGTSAAPSRLIHGGLKYLETGEFRLVAESTHERNLLLKNAPHYVHPLPSVVPIYSYFGGIWPSVRRFFGGKAALVDRGLFIVELGMTLYDLFGRRERSMPLHRFALRRKVRRTFPHMNADVVATATYYDASVSHAERLVFELVDDGVQAHPGARAINYLAASGFGDGRVELTDRQTGAVIEVQPDIIVNAAGPWIDRVNGALQHPTRYIGGAKGSHLVLDNPALRAELGDQMIYYGGSDGRVSLVYPFFEHVLIGSTDIPIADPDKAVCEPDEADYMLAALREVFPQIPITPDQVIYRYAGVRPLPQVDAANPGDVTRDHSMPKDEIGGLPVYALIGGKWTTFRAFAAEATDTILKALGKQRGRSTAFEAIGGGHGFPQSENDRASWIARFAERYGETAERSAILLQRYGTAAERIAQGAGNAFAAPLATLPDYSRGEIHALIRGEQVVTLSDLLFRRTAIAIAGQLSLAVVEELAEIAADTLNWSPDEKRRQTEAALDLARNRHGVRL